jgi:hypothetical protein
VYDVGGPERMSYRELLQKTARVLGLRRHMVTVPVGSPRLSKLWVRVFGGVPWAIVSPLIDSLRYQAEVRDNPLQRWLMQTRRRTRRHCVGPWMHPDSRARIPGPSFAAPTTL